MAKTSITRLQRTVHACLQLPGIKSGLLLNSINSKHTAWHVMHSSYTNRRGIEKSLRTINTLSAIQLGQSENPYHFLHSVISQVSTPPKCLSSLSLPTLLVLESHLQSENVTYCPHAACSCVKLQSKQTYGTHNSLVWGSLRLTPIKR